MANPVVITLAPAEADDNGICKTQTPLAAGNLTIDGALATGGVATLGSRSNGGILRPVLFTFAADESARTFTVYGTNLAGAAISEAVAGTASTAQTTIGFDTVTRVAVDDATAGAIIAGTNQVAYSPWQMVNFQITPFNLGIAVVVDGTIDYTIEYTYDNFLDLENYPSPKAFAISAFTNPFTTPIFGWRLKVNTFTAPASARITVIQAGITNR